jgi:hypothetical protein
MCLYNDLISLLEYLYPLLIPRCRVSSSTLRKKGNVHNFYERFSTNKQNSLALNSLIS